MSPSISPPPKSRHPEPFYWGVDVGGTNIKIGLLDDHGSTLAFRSIATYDEGGAAAAIKRAALTCRDLCNEASIETHRVVRAGLGTPGPMSLREGKLLNPTNLPDWHNFFARQALSDALGVPVTFINDANAAALGEFWVGVGASSSSLALLTLGTGVGGGFIVEGQLINGVNSFGSEIGHIVVDSRPDARLCVWGGGQGHLEAYASASAVSEQASKGVRAGVESSLSLVFEQHQQITAKDVHDAAAEGDAFALELVDEAAFYLGIGITCAVHMIDPGLVVLGGAMNFGGSDSPVGRRFLAGIVAEFQKRTFANVFAGTKIDFASLGGDAGYIGAAAAAQQEFHLLQKQAATANATGQEAEERDSRTGHSISKMPS